MKKIWKKIAVTSLILISLASLFAHGKNDVEEKDVENLNSWQELFNLDNKKPGVYNIMITAKDLGGNVHVEGPHNLFVDPKSDLPVCGITNPYPDMRVLGNLNIVGTCVDDDKVAYVMLVLDGDEDHPIKASGAEFWSYYLDTLPLEEGPHTIKVTGYDIYGLPGNPVTVTYQLDRNQPVTAITDREMGMLVSGKVDFAGTVSDGNGIKELSYSTDNGKDWIPVKINKGKNLTDFKFQIDTKLFPDGPTVIWFRAVDQAGSVGMYSFLYFIDNTKPDVQIVSPAADEVVNGVFSVAGFAKDTNGITELQWNFGDQSGEFELIPGNPYWCVTLNTIGSKEKNRKFTIHAKDRAQNVVEVTQTINLDQEADKPVVQIFRPVALQTYGNDDPLIVRGIATDDDGVASVKIQLDAQEAVIQETKGVFNVNLCSAKDLVAGKHKVTVSAIDVNGVEGNPVVVDIDSVQLAPVFEEPLVTVGKEVNPFANGYVVHPESGAVVNIKVNSQVGIKQMHTELHWGADGVIETATDLKNPTTYTQSIPITPDTPKGVISYVVRATDVVDRVSEYKGIFFVTNTTKVTQPDPEVIFDDSTIGDDGTILSNPDFPVTGYLIGAYAVSAELVPATKFAQVELNGNQIRLIPQPAIGQSEKVVVRVKTDTGKTYESRQLVFKSDTAVPELYIDDYSESKALDGREGVVKVSGKVTCETGVGGLKYRILSTKAEIKNAVIASVKNNALPEGFGNIAVEKDGTFSVEINTADYEAGMYVAEFVAESAGGNKAVKGVAFHMIPEIEEVKGKIPAAKPPVIAWLDGYDVYAVALYQGETDTNFKEFSRAEMPEGSNPVDFASTGEDGKTVTSKFTLIKSPTLNANIAMVNDQPYYSGMPVVLNHGSKEGAKLLVYIDTSSVVNSVSYEITGDEVPGGDLKQTGNAKLTKPTADEPLRTYAEIPLANLPARVNKINITVKAGVLEQKLSGSVTVIRQYDDSQIDDMERVYLCGDGSVVYDDIDKTYILSQDSLVYAYANFVGPVKAELVGVKEGLTIITENNLIILSASKDGSYKDVQFKVTDRFGDTHMSPKYNFMVDLSNPELVVLTPEYQQWLGKTVKLSGTVADAVGVRSVEYSLDGGENYTKIELASGKNTNDKGVTFSKEISLEELPDGLIEIDVRATDKSGHVSTIYTAAHKDTTPPSVEVIEPLESDVVNGENLLVFKATDNVQVAKAEYIAPPKKGVQQQRNAIELAPLTSILVGTPDNPIDDAMSVEFSDFAGNKTPIEAWSFSIENESDLPRSEIHVPEEMQVITRDFTISGVVYDDDGESTIFYKIDNGAYQQLPEMGTSFSINVPLATMTDNEHTVTVYAVDLNGVKGEETTRTFRVSLEEPKGAVELPTIDTSVRELVTISGYASDKNGIEKVELSLDNGNSYNDAVGTEQWSYTVDTRAIPGGTQVVFLRITDKYGITGLYSSLINIDNEAPMLNIELPLDDSLTTGTLFISGNDYDKVGVTELFVSIRNLEKTSKVDVRKLRIDRIIGETIDMGDLENGFYNVEITAKDKAGNVTNCSRNIHLDKNRPPVTVDILYPLNGEHKQGKFNIYGQSSAESEIESLKLYVDDKFVQETTITDTGYFEFALSADDIAEGVHKYHVDSILSTGVKVSSREQTLTYSPYGPWVVVENFTYGDFATNRPYLRGQAGYSISDDDVLLSKTKEATKEQKDAVAAKKVAKVELSFDNGKTYQLLSTTEKWMYRVENQDIAEGYHFLLLRATMRNGEVAVTRLIVQVDNTQPTIKLISPSTGGHYNQSLEFSGLSNDDVRLESVTLALRKGDKSSYEVPSFIQGLYLDFHFWGASLFDIGAGLTFFDDNVRLQLQWGQFTQSQRDAISNLLHQKLTSSRYGGNIIGLKLLANIATIPFSFFLGHDWEWLSASVAVGANFSLFTETNSGKPQFLSALLGQLEFPRVYFDSLKMFRTFSFYTEGSVWFIPTDVSSTVEIQSLVPQIGFGIRVNVF